MNLNKLQNKLGIILFLISLIFITFTSYIAFTKLGMWFDEIVSYDLCKYSISQIITMVSGDVHPPLYYIIYHIFVEIFFLTNITQDYIIIGKFVSLLPFYLLFIIALTKIRKNFGWLITGLFTLTLIAMPQMMNYAVEIRMYSWGMFFVTTSFIICYDILKQNKQIISWVLLTCLTICSFYTHYFSALASVILYLFLLIYFIKNNKQQLKIWIVSVIITIIAFIPWITNVLNQIQAQNGHYWIAPITLNRIIGFIFFVFSPKNEIIASNEIANISILGILLVISILVVIIYYLKNKNKDFNYNYGFYGILICISVPIVGIIGSILINPFLHPRYLIPSMGILWLSISILIAKTYDKKYIFIPILIIILFASVFGSITFYENQLYEEQVEKNITNNLEGIFDKHNIIIYDKYADNLYVSFYLSNDSHPLNLQIENHNNDELYKQIDNIINDPGIKGEIINDGKKVYLVLNKKYDEDISLDHENYTLIKICEKLDTGSKKKSVVYEIKVK